MFRLPSECISRDPALCFWEPRGMLLLDGTLNTLCRSVFQSVGTVFPGIRKAYGVMIIKSSRYPQQSSSTGIQEETSNFRSVCRQFSGSQVGLSSSNPLRKRVGYSRKIAGRGFSQ